MLTRQDVRQGAGETDQGHQHRIGQDDLQRFERPGDVRQGQLRQSAGDVSHVAQGAGRQVEEIHRQPHAKDGRQRWRHGTGQARQEPDDGHGRQGQTDHQIQRGAAEPGVALLEVFQLGQGDDDGQAVDEAQHDGVRHHADQLAQAQQAEGNHQQAAQHHCGQQVLHAVLDHQGDDHHRHGAGGAGDHAGPSAEEGREGTDEEGAIEPHQWIEMGNQGERDALGHQREGRGETGQDVGAGRNTFHGVARTGDGTRGTVAEKPQGGTERSRAAGAATRQDGSALDYGGVGRRLDMAEGP